MIVHYYTVVCRFRRLSPVGKIYFIHHHLPEATSETANVLELRQKLLYNTPSRWRWWWWWWIWVLASLRTFTC